MRAQVQLLLRTILQVDITRMSEAARATLVASGLPLSQ